MATQDPSRVLEIPAGLTQVLRRGAVDLYAAELDRAHDRATSYMESPDEMGAWTETRAALRDADATLTLIGDDLASDDGVEIMLDNRACQLLDRLLDEMVVMTSTSLKPFDPEPDDIVKAARLIEQLQALRAELPAGAFGTRARRRPRRGYDSAAAGVGK